MIPKKKKKRDYLKKYGIKNAIQGIKKGHPNILVNNNKHVTYSQYDKYNSCGHPKNKLCSRYDELQCFEHGCCLKNIDE